MAQIVVAGQVLSVPQDWQVAMERVVVVGQSFGMHGGSPGNELPTNGIHDIYDRKYSLLYNTSYEMSGSPAFVIKPMKISRLRGSTVREDMMALPFIPSRELNTR